MNKCDQCVHDDDTGCRMLDCIYHPDCIKNGLAAMTNTFRDRFLDEKENPFKKKEAETLW